jgi:hypothetical protein
MGNPYNEIRLGTQADGAFAITNVPPGVEWYLYGKMESLATRGATESIPCATKSDGQEIDIGDIQVQPGYRFRGKVVLADGQPIAGGMRVTISADPGRGHAWDSQTVLLATDGSFEFTGLRADTYSVFASVRGYEMQDAEYGTLQWKVDSDVDGFVITMARK